MIGFQENRANTLVVEDGKFAGQVADPIVGREAKLATLRELRESFDLDAIDTLAPADGVYAVHAYVDGQDPPWPAACIARAYRSNARLRQAER